MLHQVVNIFHLLEVLVLQKSSKILLCVSLEAEPGPCPRAALLFLNSSSLVSHPLPSLISNCLNLPFGTRGRSRRLNEAYSLQTRNRGHRKASGPRSPAGSCSVSFGGRFSLTTQFPDIFTSIDNGTTVRSAERKCHRKHLKASPGNPRHSVTVHIGGGFICLENRIYHRETR